MLTHFDQEVQQLFPGLGCLVLEKNMINTCPKISFSYMPHLSELNLLGNRFKGLYPNLSYIPKVYFEWTYVQDKQFQIQSRGLKRTYLDKISLTRLSELVLSSHKEEITFTDYLVFSNQSLNLEEKRAMFKVSLTKKCYPIWKDLVDSELDIIQTHGQAEKRESNAHTSDDNDAFSIAILNNVGEFFSELYPFHRELFSSRLGELCLIHKMVIQKYYNITQHILSRGRRYII